MLLLYLLSAMALAVAGFGMMRYIYTRPVGHRLGMVRQWSEMPQLVPCKKCGGWGALDKNKNKFPMTKDVLQSVMWREGNTRTCGKCLGRGFVTPHPSPDVTQADVDTMNETRKEQTNPE